MEHGKVSLRRVARAVLPGLSETSIALPAQDGPAMARTLTGRAVVAPSAAHHLPSEHT